MTPALIGLLVREDDAHHRARTAVTDQPAGSPEPFNGPTPFSASEEGTVADLAYLASLPLRG